MQLRVSHFSDIAPVFYSAAMLLAGVRVPPHSLEMFLDINTAHFCLVVQKSNTSFRPLMLKKKKLKRPRMMYFKHYLLWHCIYFL